MFQHWQTHRQTQVDYLLVPGQEDMNKEDRMVVLLAEKY